jgi:threonine/homoserine/homoserine lactone efflux protein
VLNPKVAVFYLAALPQFVGHGPDAPLKGVLLIAIHYAIGGAWLSAIALGAGRAGEAFRTSPAMRWLEGVAGVFLLGVAGRLAVERR